MSSFLSNYNAAASGSSNIPLVNNPNDQWLRNNGFSLGSSGRWTSSSSNSSGNSNLGPTTGSQPTPDAPGYIPYNAGKAPGYNPLASSGAGPNLSNPGMPNLPMMSNDYNRLGGVFNRVGAAFNTEEYARKANDNIGTLQAVTENSANNIGRNFLTQSNMAGGGLTGSIGANVLRANALLAGGSEIGKQTLDAQKYIDSQKQGNITQQAQIANQLATLQSNYIGTLASYNSARSNNAQEYTKLGLNKFQFDQSLAQKENENLNKFRQEGYQFNSKIGQRNNEFENTFGQNNYQFGQDYELKDRGLNIEDRRLEMNDSQFQQSYLIEQAKLQLQQDAAAKEKAKTAAENAWGWDDGLGQKAGVYADPMSPYYRG